jgi:DNA-binding transcriptional LysR family regulator
MRIEELESFCGVVESGSFTSAARRLFLTQAAVSRQVSGLERTLGVTLIGQPRRQLRLTQAGESVYEEARQLLRHARSIQATANQTTDAHCGQIRVTAGTVAGNYLLPETAARYQDRYPEVHIDLRPSPAPAVFEQVAQERADFGLTLGPDLPAGLRGVPAFSVGLSLIVSANHPLTQHPGKVPMEELRQLKLIGLAGRRGQSRRLYESWLRSAGISPAVSSEMHSYEQIKGVVMSSERGAFMFPMVAASELAAGRVRMLETERPFPRGDFVFVLRPSGGMSAAAATYLTFVRSALMGIGRSGTG